MTFPRWSKFQYELRIQIYQYIWINKKKLHLFFGAVYLPPGFPFPSIYVGRKSRTLFYARITRSLFIFFEASPLLYSQRITWVLIRRQTIICHRKENRVPVFLKLHANFMHIGSALSLPTGKGSSRENSAPCARAHEAVQNIALWGSNLPDGRKGAGRTRKMRNSTRNGRMFWNHGARRSSSDNVEEHSPYIYMYIYIWSSTYIHSHACTDIGYMHMSVWDMQTNRYTRKSKCISVTWERVQKYKSLGALNQGPIDSTRFIRVAPFSSICPLDAVIQRNRRPRQREKLKPSRRDKWHRCDTFGSIRNSSREKWALLNFLP